MPTLIRWTVPGLPPGVFCHLCGEIMSSRSDDITLGMLPSDALALRLHSMVQNHRVCTKARESLYDVPDMLASLLYGVTVSKWGFFHQPTGQRQGTTSKSGGFLHPYLGTLMYGLQEGHWQASLSKDQRIGRTLKLKFQKIWLSTNMFISHPLFINNP